jgi:MFS family permease
VVPSYRNGCSCILVSRTYSSLGVSQHFVPMPADCKRIDRRRCSAFGGLIAFGIGHITSSIPNWKWIFIIEALPAFCLGLSCLYWLPDRPLSNSRFSGQHQEIAKARYMNEAFDKAGKIQQRHVVMTLTDWRLYVQAAIYVPTAALLSSISGFLPTIISSKSL